MTKRPVSYLVFSGLKGDGSIRMIDAITGVVIREAALRSKLDAPIADFLISSEYMYVLDTNGNLVCYDLDNVFSSYTNLRKYGAVGKALFETPEGICVLTTNGGEGADPALSELSVIRVLEQGSLVALKKYLLDSTYFADTAANQTKLATLDAVFPSFTQTTSLNDGTSVDAPNTWLPVLNPYNGVNVGFASFQTQYLTGFSTSWGDLDFTSFSDIHPTSKSDIFFQQLNSDSTQFTFNLFKFGAAGHGYSGGADVNRHHGYLDTHGGYNLEEFKPAGVPSLNPFNFNKGCMQVYLNDATSISSTYYESVTYSNPTRLTMVVPFKNGSSDVYSGDTGLVCGVVKYTLDLTNTTVLSAVAIPLKYPSTETTNKYVDTTTLKANQVDGSTNWLLSDSYCVWCVTEAGDIVWTKQLMTPVTHGNGQELNYAYTKAVTEYFVKGTVQSSDVVANRDVFIHNQRTGAFLGNARVTNGEYAFACYNTSKKYAVCQSGDDLENWQIRANLTPVALPTVPVAYVYPAQGLPYNFVAANQPPGNIVINGG